MNNFISEVTNEDCMAGMARYPDKYFDLAIVDPPYGIGMDGGNIGGNNATKATNYTKKDWDILAPNKDYFIELKRVSKNVVIWGANHFIKNIPYNSSCWIVWDKDNTGNFADAELAYTSFKSAVRIFKFRWNGMLQQNMKNKEQRIHPTQKPVALYKWLLQNYAKQGDKILDTHLGSGSSRIAAYEMGFDFTAFELDKEYFEAQEKRYNNHISQLKLNL
jgi:site-specific DNA-methyltransferase (adenine-specific)